MAAIDCEVLDGIDDVNANQWNNVVAQTDTGTVFHRTGWLRAVEEGLGYEGRHVVVRKNGNPIAICPNVVSTVETPFELPRALARLGLAEATSTSPGYGGPVVASDRDRAFPAILAAIDRDAGWQTFVHRLRILDPAHVQFARTLESRGYTPSLLYCRHWLPLDDYDERLAEMDSARRREIATSTDDVSVREEDVTVETMRAFYEEYRKTLDRVEGQPYPRSFFEALADHLADRVELFTAVVDGEPAGTHLCLRDDEQDSLHYFFSGVDADYFRYSSPTVLHDYAIRWAIEEGYDVYDFGGTSAHFDDGVFTYKSKFGTQTEPVYEWEKGQSLLRYRLFDRSRRRYLKGRYA